MAASWKLIAYQKVKMPSGPTEREKVYFVSYHSGSEDITPFVQQHCCLVGIPNNAGTNPNT